MNNTLIENIILKDTLLALLHEGKIIKIRADGYSMFPVIKPGSEVFIQPFTPKENPEPGDIIAWKRESGIVVHRLACIIKTSEKVIFLTRGDSCLRTDPPVARESILGKVIRVERKNKRLVDISNLRNRRPLYLLNRFLVTIIIIFEKTRVRPLKENL